MLGIITCKADDGIAAPGRHMIGSVRDLVGYRMDQAVRQTQVAMVGQYHRLVHHFSDPGNVSGIQLWHVQVDHIGPASQFPGHGRHGGHDQTFADAHQWRHPHHRNSIQTIQARQAAIILGSQDGHLMTAPGKGARHPFCINGQAGSMRTVVGETGKDMHG